MERLKSRKQIELLFKEGHSFSHFPFRVIWSATGHDGNPLQAGFSVSSRFFKKAVDRNRVKRLMRESYRLQKHELQAAVLQQQKKLSVFLIYTGNELPDFELVYSKAGSLIKRLIKLINENTGKDI